jgi:hypothetical protein
MWQQRGARGCGAVLVAVAGWACEGGGPIGPLPLPQPRLVSGIVVDTDDHPVSGARVTQGQASAWSGPDGRFLLVVPGGGAYVTIAAVGFEPRGWDLGSADAPDRRIPIARRVDYTLGQTLSVSLTTHDLPYYVGEAYESDYCRPCKLIRIDGGADRPFTRVHLRWSGEVALGLWASEGTSGLAADVVGPRHLSVPTIGNGDARRLYVGVTLGNTLTQPITFSLSAE